MADPIPVPVGILRLPRGPDSSGSRGFHRDRDHRDHCGADSGSRDHCREHCGADSGSRDHCGADSGCRDHSRDHCRADSGCRAHCRDLAALQGARAALRERFLRLLGRARGRRARFCLCTGLRVLGDFGAADVQSGALQVDSLWTPLGVEASALLRSGDVLEFSFPLE